MRIIINNKNMKGLVQSRTFWLAIIQGVAGVIVILETELPGVGWVAIVKSVLDVLLRLATGKPVVGFAPRT